MTKALALFVCLLAAASAAAQERPFVFTVTTGPPDAASGRGRPVPWAAYYDCRLRRADELSPSATTASSSASGCQGRLGAASHARSATSAFGLGDSMRRAAASTPRCCGTSSAPASRVRLALGARGPPRVGRDDARRSRACCLGWNSGRRTLLFGNLRPGEAVRAMAATRIDLITTLGWLHGKWADGLRAGRRGGRRGPRGTCGRSEEAEGGSQALCRPGAALDGSPAGRLCGLAASGGPVVYAHVGVGAYEPGPAAARRRGRRLHRAGVDRLHVLRHGATVHPRGRGDQYLRSSVTHRVRPGSFTRVVVVKPGTSAPPRLTNSGVITDAIRISRTSECSHDCAEALDRLTRSSNAREKPQHRAEFEWS